MSDSDDDIDDLLLGTLGQSSKKTVTTRSNAKEFESDEDVVSDASESGFVNLYPLEGKYKDKADRARIEALPEIERETELYDRDKQVAELREKAMLRRRLKQQQAQQAAQEKTSAARRSERDATQPKLTAIQELKRKREAKTNKSAKSEEPSKRSRHDFSSSDEDSDGSDDEQFDTPATRRAAEKRERNRQQEADDIEGSRPIMYQDALLIRMSRKTIMKFLYHPEFPETAIDCFVRISIGSSSAGKSIYRLCQVKETVSATRPYKLPNGDFCKRALSCAHGSSVRTFEATYISDSVFTEQEYDDWVKTMNKDKLRLMSKRRVKAKLAELKEMSEHILTDAEINAMIEEKRKLSKIPTNVAMEKMRISGLIAEAREANDTIKAEELTNELAKIEELTANRGRNGDLDKMSKLNERNRQSTMRAVGKAELTNADKRRQAELTGKSGGDPFSRLKTRPKTFYESTPSSPMPGSPVIAASNNTSVVATPSSATKKKAGGVEGLIGSIDLDLDL